MSGALHRTVLSRRARVINFYTDMKSHMKRALVLAFGCTFLALGIVGLVLPFLQGILFIIIGILLLSVYSKTIQDGLELHAHRFPKVHELVARIRARIAEFISRP